MFEQKTDRAGKGVLSSPVRSAIVWTLVCGLCALNFPPPARANEGSTLLPERLEAVGVQPAARSRIRGGATALRWTLLPKASLAPAPVIPSSQPETVTPARLAEYSLLRPVRVFPLPKTALPPSPSRPGRGRWLALGIGGLAVVAVGAGTYAVGNGEFPCGGGSSPSNGCHTARTVGLVLMPIGGVMAVAGFVKYFRH